MFRSILVPLDGSKFAEAALPIAESIARRAGASLEIVRSHEPFEPEHPADCWMPRYDPDEEAAHEAQEQAYLDATVNTLQEKSSISVKSALVSGAVVSGVLKRARACAADLIVMATHGRGPVGRFMLGSVADKLLRHASIPVLFVRSGDDSQPLTAPDFNHILIPLDGSVLAECALPPAIAIGHLADARITLLRAVERGYQPFGHAAEKDRNQVRHDENEQRILDAARYLEKIAARLRLESPRVEKIVLEGEADGAILQESTARKVDLIAMATHGRGGIKRLLLGSVADKVIRSATTPVLAYRPNELFEKWEESSGPDCQKTENQN
jgi:nucleotide-binding universal stress UspA family protein